MSYYDEKKRELLELLRLVREEKVGLEQAARLERKAIDEKQKEVLKLEKEKRKELLEIENRLAKDEEAINQLAKQKSQGFPWLAKAYSDYYYLQDLKFANGLEAKSHPATKAAEQIREIASKRRIAERLHRVLRYKLEYYERLFPWLVDFGEEGIDDLIKQVVEKREAESDTEEPDDPVKKYLTQVEYAKLSTAERNQRAIDRYWRKPKKKWQIGRDYERYIGYLYESRGYGVYYQGIVEGLADLGRDLICVKDDSTEIVQCKYWSKEKEIHEKHIFQLYGTVVAYKIDHSENEKKVSACFVTSTTLSDRAKQFANELRIKTLENYPLEHYPCIKCNVSRRDGTKIYHLPFNQQYDRTLIEEERNECYVETVKEAEDSGFRRAFRWRGTAESSGST
ncbi:MAG TPA: restriction endonuclease [Dehalococcoidia bacterium]|nr:restriction endonuclease [Dehalococcoidia bacterium]